MSNMEKVSPIPHRVEYRIDSQVLKNAQSKANHLMARKFPRIRETDFNAVHGAHIVRNDLDDIKNLEERWQREGSEQTSEGIIFEAILFDMIHNTQWFGDTSILRTAKFDDYLHGVDALLGLHVQKPAPSTSYLGLGIDATTSMNGLRGKLSRTLEHVRNGTLGTVRYAEIGSVKKKMGGVPEVVLFAERSSFKDMVTRWTISEIPRDDRSPEQERSFNELAGHPFQIELLAQMWFQLQTFEGVAKKSGTGNDNTKRITDAKNIVFQRISERVRVLQLDKDIFRRLIDDSPSIKTLKTMLVTHPA